MEIFSSHKTLNLKKVIIFIVIILLLLTLLLFFIEKEPSDVIVPNNSNPNSIFTDTKKSISLELSKMYNLKQYDSKEDYLIELRSDENLNVFVSFKENISGKDLKDIVSADKLAFTETFEKISNISELKELNVNENLAYTYSFHYLDQNLKKAFYIQIVWILVGNNYYIFDIEFPLENINIYANFINDVLFKFKTL